LTSLQDIEGTYQISEAKSRVLLHLIHVRGTIDQNLEHPSFGGAAEDRWLTIALVPEET
jgi:hypothetical protein